MILRDGPEFAGNFLVEIQQLRRVLGEEEASSRGLGQMRELPARSVARLFHEAVQLLAQTDGVEADVFLREQLPKFRVSHLALGVRAVGHHDNGPVARLVFQQHQPLLHRVEKGGAAAEFVALLEQGEQFRRIAGIVGGERLDFGAELD